MSGKDMRRDERKGKQRIEETQSRTERKSRGNEEISREERK